MPIARYRPLHFELQTIVNIRGLIPKFQRSWKDLSYKELAFEIFSLYISSSEIPPDDLKDIIDRSYSTFREEDVTPLVHLQDDNLYLLELFHGPSYSFKDCALCLANWICYLG
jgi:threonine synthase